MLKENIMTHRYILILTALLVAILLLTMTTNNPLTASAEDTQLQSHYGAAQRPATLMSPLQALSNKKPTVFFFYPLDTCRIRYCQQPSQIAGMVNESYGEQVNFVAVAINSMTYGPDPNSSPYHRLATWDAYPVEPYAEWLPEAKYRAMENTLPEPKTVLIDPAGNLVYEGGEFFPWVQIESNIESMLGN